jgi:hypothetical protein
MQMPFILPEYEDQGKDEGERPSLLKMGSESSVTTSPPTITEGELTLVDKVSSLRNDGIIRRRSIEEIASLHSFRSGSSNKSNRSNKSDIDRLIDAIV